MNFALKQFTIAITVLSLLIAPISATASVDGPDEPEDLSAAAMVTDTILVRPLGFVSMIAGLGLFIVSSPFSALGGNFGDAWGIMVAKPAKFTFARPLGDF